MGERAFVAKKKLADAICAALTVHATVEEEIFYPAVRASVPNGKPMIDEATVEHAGAKDLIAQLLSMDANEELFDAKIKVLSEQIEHHVKEEESEMFVRAKKSALDLVALGEQMAARKEELGAKPIRL
ncbi:hemerythrin-like domain-containing protein [Actimicrobium sp. GrIS 1.19]|nr:hemerythrin-like domain-containing protein [Actimicrobium sp. GrIS 1.19]